MKTWILFKLLFLSLLPLTVLAGPREQAKFLNDRIVGTNISAQEFESLVSMISQGNARQAALSITERSDFYNVKLKTFFAPRTNEDRSNTVPLNDYTATLIGIVRDNVPYTSALYEDIIYVGANGLNGVPAYSHTNNNHYEELEKRRIDLSSATSFVRTTQSGLAGTQLPVNATAGIITTRAAAKAFFVAGTNRAMTRFLSLNYLCRDFEALHDISLPQDRVRKDVTRVDPYLKDCVGCHSGQDGLGGAWAYYNFDEEENRLVYTAGNVQEKMNINAGVAPQGYQTVDDSWVNYWRIGQNSALGWRTPANAGISINSDFGYSFGSGAKSLGREIASTRAFSACAVKQVFENVCLKNESQLTSADKAKIEEISTAFEQSNYNYKTIWVETGLYCMGD